ncbi:ABC transporter ATP-binding protein/permease wht-3 [Hypsibius exemplaris]|uniref:ABC transporter ATP-binding protein/permease wht-3 n=1 Tax=Hypsibius exemplaris TaxID=2072580 RepID=A0A9X6NKG3_HYPEX|nr:ABC transporter ATP-binding protein/permease wht-3 [Hypsibius exemplaris]
MIANRAVSSSLQENPEVDQDYDSDDELLPADHYEGIGLRDDSTSSYDAVTASFSKALRPTASVTISFEDLTVRTRRGKRSGPATVWRPVIENLPAADEVMLLDHVSGYAEPGEVLAIMGPSGSGKSTLLNVIMNRNLSPKFDVSGVVRVNGYEIGRKIARISGYLQQNDLLFPSLTVAEYLRFQVALCLGDVLDSSQQDEKVLNMLSTMGLLSCQHTKIGQPGLGKSISGGEMKRLAFAAELLSDPAVLFCDEPTTGLDSFRAEQVVAVLRQLALLGKTIICVIHQPSSTVFEMFNRIIFLANGRVAFQGQIACAKNFFESIGHFLPTKIPA